MIYFPTKKKVGDRITKINVTLIRKLEINKLLVVDHNWQNIILEIAYEAQIVFYWRPNQSCLIAGQNVN